MRRVVPADMEFKHLQTRSNRERAQYAILHVQAARVASGQGAVLRRRRQRAPGLVHDDPFVLEKFRGSEIKHVAELPAHRDTGEVAHPTTGKNSF